MVKLIFDLLRILFTSKRLAKKNIYNIMFLKSLIREKHRRISAKLIQNKDKERTQYFLIYSTKFDIIVQHF